MKKPTGADDVIESLIAKHRVSIAKHGFTVQAVLPSEDTPPYLYTIGLTKTFGHPEIFLVGLRPEDAMGMIHDIVNLIRGGSRFDKPMFASGIIPGYEIPFIPMTDESVIDHSAMGLELIGPFDGVQMFYPDRNGYVPWEKECDEAYRSQLFFDLEGDLPRRNITLEEARASIPPQPPLTKEEIAENRRRLIELRRQEMLECGYVPQPVGGGDGQPGFLYTIGLTETWNHPEFFIVGLHPRQADAIIADFIERIEGGERFDTPAYVSDILTVPVSVRPLQQEAVDDNSGIAQDMLNRNISGVQIFWPDKKGLMPWEDGCDREIARIQLSIFTPEGDEPVRQSAPPSAPLH
jgi:hypothetical protein